MKKERYYVVDGFSYQDLCYIIDGHKVDMGHGELHSVVATYHGSDRHLAEEDAKKMNKEVL